jgi:hypothetical protein
MDENKAYQFDHKEVAEVLIKHKGLHEGLWGISIEFAIAATNISRDTEGFDLTPAAIVPVVKIGIQRFEKPNRMTVDAAIVNPPPRRGNAAKKAATAKAR